MGREPATTETRFRMERGRKTEDKEQRKRCIGLRNNLHTERVQKYGPLQRWNVRHSRRITGMRQKFAAPRFVRSGMYRRRAE